MTFDIFTLVICELCVLFFLSVIMVFAWKGSQYNHALGFQCLSLIISVVAVYLRNAEAMFWTIVISNILLILAYSMQALAFRSFRRAKSGVLWLLGPLIWTLLCLTPPFYYSPWHRHLANCILCITYTGWMIAELHRSRLLLPVTYWPAQLLLWIHLFLHLVRILLMSFTSSSWYNVISFSTFSIYIILESTMLVISLTFAMLAMVNEHTQIKYKQASLLDPLTGTWNRRALFEKGNKLGKFCLKKNLPLAVILFDLDHFKSINDCFGHYLGDIVLMDFCRQVEPFMPVTGYFARLGGEEFAAIISASEKEALDYAENIRRAVENAQPEGVHYTVSIGVATRLCPHQQIASLMVAADEALYQAKAQGRNRVRLFVASPRAEIS